MRTWKRKTVILSASIVSITMIDLRRKLPVMYVIKRIMKFKYKNRKNCALFLRINSMKAYLLRKQLFTSISSTLFGCDSGMSQDRFWDIVRVVQPALEKGDTQFWRAIPIKKHVTITLWRLLTDSSFVLLQKYLQSLNQRLFKLLRGLLRNFAFSYAVYSFSQK